MKELNTALEERLCLSESFDLVRRVLQAASGSYYFYFVDGFVKDEAGGLLADFPDEGLGGGSGAGKRGEGLFEVFGEGGCVYVRAKLGEGGIGLGDEGFGLLEGLF